MEKLSDKDVKVKPEFLRISVTVPWTLLSQFDEESNKRGYTRSEAVRTAMRRLLSIWTGARI